LVIETAHLKNEKRGQHRALGGATSPEKWVFLPPHRLNSPALRGFIAQRRWNDGFGVFAQEHYRN
jgi:hypothetical protein